MKYVLYNFKPNRYELRELDGEFLEHHNRLDGVRVIQDGPTQQQLDMERHKLKPYSDYGSCTNSSIENIYDELSSNNVKCWHQLLPVISTNQFHFRYNYLPTFAKITFIHIESPKDLLLEKFAVILADLMHKNFQKISIFSMNFTYQKTC